MQIVACAVTDLFEGNVKHFLALLDQGPCLFEDISNLLDQQFQRLSPSAQALMYWLAINREPISLKQLQTDTIDVVSPGHFLEALTSLQHRSMIEKINTQFTQQPVVMEYVTDRFIRQIVQEITSSNLALFRTHAIVQATAKDYVRETQVNLILQPIINRLLSNYGCPRELTTRLYQILSKLRGSADLQTQGTGTGYVCGNVINLLRQLQVDLTGADFSRLTVWQANLQNLELHDVNFARADLSHSVFTETSGNILSAAFSPEGQLMATCDTDCNIRIWDVQTGQLQVICQGHQNWVRAIAFTNASSNAPGTLMLASGGADHTIKLWKVNTGECLQTLVGHTNEVFSIAVMPDQPFLASSSSDQTLKLWDIDSGQCIRTFEGHTERVWTCCF